MHTQQSKQWPSANRLDDVYDDRNLFCACVPMEAYDKTGSDEDTIGRSTAQVA